MSVALDEALCWKSRVSRPGDVLPSGTRRSVIRVVALRGDHHGENRRYPGRRSTRSAHDGSFEAEATLGCGSLRPDDRCSGDRARGAQSIPLRAGEQPRAGTAASPADFITESRNKLKALQENLAGLGNRALAGIKPGDEATGDVTSQRLMVDSAKARYESARLVREAAEISVTQYAESVFKDEMAQVDGEIKLAQFELTKAKPRIERAEERYAKIEQVTSGSTADLAIKWNLEDGVLSARLQERKARFGIEQAQSKLKVLVEYEKLKRIKEFRSEGMIRSRPRQEP